MEDILWALGVVLLVEGVIYALFPEAMRRMMRLVVQMPETQLRIVGLVALVTGALIIYVVKS